MNDDRPWPLWKLALVLYPFAAGAVAINLFMASLLAPVIGLDPMSPITALIWSVPLGIPAAWAFARWARRLMDEADGRT
ncbi:hypothetical protein [Sulfitobacter sp. JB4-11]|uniref:hypothetical protein n=1 Tax=Sulfitobacter rhodophyticola TaxID=3238304 RepID=UPI003515FF43